MCKKQKSIRAKKCKDGEVSEKQDISPLFCCEKKKMNNSFLLF